MAQSKEQVAERQAAYYRAHRSKILLRSKEAAEARKARLGSDGERQYNRRRLLFSKYRLEIEDWDRMLVAQSGRCAACRDPMTSPVVDHNHATGAVRCLLCHNCNAAVGHLKENPARAQAVLEYIKSFQENFT